jgi:tetratricopeptide (TPR) repeat protein
MAEESAVQYARSMVAYPSKAQEILEELREILTELPDSRDTMSRIQTVFEEANRPYLYLQWGIILARMNNNDQALQQLSRTLQLLSSKAQEGPMKWFRSWRWIRELLLAFPTSEDRQVALNQIEAALNQLGSAYLWIELGEVLADLQADRQAMDSYIKALRLDPSTPDLPEHFAKTLKRSADQSAALQEVQAAVDSASRADVFYTWGKILDNLGERELATGQYQQAIRLKHDFAEAYYALGQIFAGKGRYRESCTQFQKAVEYNQGYANAIAIFEWGATLLKSGRQEEALQKYLQAIKIAPYILKMLQSVQDLLKWDDTVVARFQSAVDGMHTAEAYTQWGVLLYQIGRYEQAIQQHQQAVRLDPDLEDPYTNWRKAMGKAGISAERIREYNQAIEEYRNNADAYYEWGHYLYRLRWIDQAAEKFQKALEKDPKHSDAHANWINCLFELNDVKRAREEAKRLLAYNPHNPAAYSCLAGAAYLDGKYDEAIQQSELGIESGSGFALLLFARHAWALYMDGQEGLALRKLEEATRKMPVADAYFEYGNLLLELKHYAEAVIQFQKATELDSNYAYAYHNLAAIPFDQGQYEEAWSKWMDALKAYEQREPALDRVLDKNQFVDSREFYYHATVTQTIQHKSQEAEAILKEGLAFDPQNTLVLGGLTILNWERKEECLGAGTDISRQKSAYHWQAMGYFHQAERLLKERLDRYPNYFVLTELGDLYLTVEEYEKARSCFEEARLKDENNAVPYAKLGVVHLRQKQPDKAIPLLQEALRRNPNDLEVQSSLAEAYLRAEKLDDAEDAYREVLAIAPNHVQSLIGLGEVCTARGEKKDTDRFSEAIECFSRALEVAEQEKTRSKYLKKQEAAAVYYSLGYARVQLYEASGIHREARLLKQALADFQQCVKFNPAHQKAVRAIEKIQDRLSAFSLQRLTETIGPLSMFTMSLIIFVAVQFTENRRESCRRPLYTTP